MGQGVRPYVCQADSRRRDEEAILPLQTSCKLIAQNVSALIIVLLAYKAGLSPLGLNNTGALE